MATREQWLNAALVKVRQHLLEQAAVRVPDNVRVSCGFSLRSGRKALGQCWTAVSSADGTIEIFIAPQCAEPLIVLATLIHEGIHASGIMNHKAAFKAAAIKAGLEGKMTATVASARLNEVLQTWLDSLGIYPHATLTPDDSKKQKTRLVKCTCPGCGYVVRTTAKWLEQSGAPFCGCTADDGEGYTQMVTSGGDDSGEGEES